MPGWPAPQWSLYAPIFQMSQKSSKSIGTMGKLLGLASMLYQPLALVYIWHQVKSAWYRVKERKNDKVLVPWADFSNSSALKQSVLTNFTMPPTHLQTSPAHNQPAVHAEHELGSSWRVHHDRWSLSAGRWWWGWRSGWQTPSLYPAGQASQSPPYNGLQSERKISYICFELVYSFMPTSPLRLRKYSEV